jgi:hypothetical protein
MKRIIYILAAGLLFFSACKKDFLDRYPLDAISDENYWETSEQLKLAANGTYAYLKAKTNVDLENIGDNTTWPTTTDFQRISTGNYGSDLGSVNAEWTNAYDGIRRCNHFLENYNRGVEVPVAEKERYAGEVRFIRAYLYYLLTSFYGDVPLLTKTLTPQDEELYGKRQARNEVVDFMLAELDSCTAKLPTSYGAVDYGRITKGAALAFKARVALQHNKFDVAETAAKAVMDLNIYSLYSNGNKATSYYELFTYKGEQSKNGSNKETILARVHVPEVSMHNLSREIQVPDQEIRWNPTKSLVDAYLCKDGLPINKSPLYSELTYADIFKNRDPRMVQTVLAPGSAWKGLDDGDADNTPNDIYNWPKFTSDKKGAVTVTGYYFTKYCELSTVGVVSKDENDIILIRFAEVLLTWAEARLEQGKLTQTDINNSVNKIRDRVGMVPMLITDITANGLNLRDEIRRERRIELALEGQRWFDLMRWKQGSLLAADVKGMKKSLARVPSEISSRPADANGFLIFNTNRIFVEPKHYLWPVPLVQYQRNENLLPQNPGW